MRDARHDPFKSRLTAPQWQSARRWLSAFRVPLEPCHSAAGGGSIAAMSRLSRFVSIHPYFKIHPGRLDEFRSVMPKFIERTRSEPGCLFYEFTIEGDEVHCREGYTDAAATLAHVENVREPLEEALAFADLARLEFHGPAEELEKLKAPLAAFDARYFPIATGVEG